MKQSVKISIIIPLYNTPIDYFRDCLQSIVDQGMNKMIEVIIVDDCSTENYSEIYNEFLNLNLTILRPEKNSGPGVCRHTGAAHVLGVFARASIQVRGDVCGAGRPRLLRLVPG